MFELKKSIPKVKEHLTRIIEGISACKCTVNPAHKDCFIGYVCLASNSERRLICTRCIDEDVDFIQAHGKHIINLKKFEEMAHDRCIDMFADDIEKNSNEIEFKYGKKLERLAKSSIETVNEKLNKEFP